MLRLLGTTGGDKAAETVKEALKSDNVPIQSAALAALGNWSDDTQFGTLNDFIEETDNDSLRKKAFDAAYSFLRNDRKRNSDDLAGMWQSLTSSANDPREKLQIIRGLANEIHPWSVTILGELAKDKDDKVIDKAEQAKRYVERRLSEKGSAGSGDGS